MSRTPRVAATFLVAAAAAFVVGIAAARAQVAGKKNSAPLAEREQRPSVSISFLPPPLENATFSVGVFDSKTGKLVRRLHEIAPASAFTAGLNGFLTKWDRRDDAGNPVPPGKYAAHGWAVGPLKVEGVDVLGNEWVDEDEDLRIKRVEAIALVPADDGLVTVCRMADGSAELVRFSPPGRAGAVWRKKIALAPTAAAEPTPTASAGKGSWVLNVAKGTVSVAGQSFALADGSPRRAAPAHTTGVALPPPPPANVSLGRNETVWTIDESGLSQRSLSGAILRQLPLVPQEPAPRAVAASETHEKLYLLEEIEGWQRVRGLEWADTRQEAGGGSVSEWKTFFQRSIRQSDPALGLESPPGGAAAKVSPPAVVEQTLIKNPLLGRGKIATAKLSAGFNDKGSYLETADSGLRLRKISERPHLLAVKLVKGAPAAATAEKDKDKATTASAKEDALTFYQFDGAAWDVFSITSVNRLMAFDAGEFELTATGEKLPEGEPKEPRDL